MKRVPEIKKVDTKIYKLVKPATINYLMSPLVGIVDGFWVSKLGNSEKLAGQGCADQIYNIFYRFSDFYSPIIAPEISLLNARNETEKISEIASTSLLSISILSIFVSLFVLCFSDKITSFFIKDNYVILDHTLEYLKYRVIGLPFSLINSVIFSILRGMMDFNSAIKANFKSQFLNIIADPIFMIRYDIKGLAIASVISEIYCTYEYIKLLNKKGIKYNKFKNSFVTFLETIQKSFYIQFKTLCYSLLTVVTNNKITSIDPTGKKVAAHILSLKLFDLGTIFSNGLNSVSSILISNEQVFNNDKIARNRLLYWSNWLGIFQFIIFLNSNLFLRFFTNDVVVLNECKKISLLIALFGYTNNISTIIDGILQGYQKYRLQSIFAFFTLLLINLSMVFVKDLKDIWFNAFLITVTKIIAIFKFL
jgi:putative MATE family efflux protein